MSMILPMIEARKRLTNLPEELQRNPQTGEVIITRHGKPVLALLSWELYESIMETIEIMGDETLMAALRLDIQRAKTERTYGLKEIQQEIGI